VRLTESYERVFPRAITADTYTHVLLDDRELDYAALTR
jgi:hypothetical protein